MPSLAPSSDSCATRGKLEHAATQYPPPEPEPAFSWYAAPQLAPCHFHVTLLDKAIASAQQLAALRVALRRLSQDV